VTTPAEDILLKIPEACRRLSISRATFYRLLDRGLIRTTPIGTRGQRVHIDDVEECARRLREQGAA
jgi:excisionase family DNA binding protein